MTLTSDEILDVIAREVPGPRHTAGIDLRIEEMGGVHMSLPYLKVWCSCGWAGDTITLPGRSVNPDDVPEEAMEEAARSWRFHVRLSNRLYGIDKRLRRQATRARATAEEEE